MGKQIETLDCPCCGAEFPAVLTSSVRMAAISDGAVVSNTALNIKAFRTRAEAERELRR